MLTGTNTEKIGSRGSRVPPGNFLERGYTIAVMSFVFAEIQMGIFRIFPLHTLFNVFLFPWKGPL